MSVRAIIWWYTGERDQGEINKRCRYAFFISVRHMPPISFVSQSQVTAAATAAHEQRTLISASNLSATFFRWTFCAAVTSPLSGVHSSAVSTTACSVSIPLKPAFLPAALHSRSTSALTFAFAQSVASCVWGSSSGSAARRCPSCGTMMAMGCVASGVACTHMFETRLHDLYVDSRRSSAMYSPPWSFTRFLMLHACARAQLRLKQPWRAVTSLTDRQSTACRPCSTVQYRPCAAIRLS
jgi:hypothetical protein